MSKPHIHFIQAGSLEDAEKDVNNWIDNLEYTCNILTIHVMPMMYSGNLVFVTVITFIPEQSYHSLQSRGG